MVRKATDASSPSRVPTKPWWVSPLVPLVLLTSALVLLGLDGLHPYRTYLRKRSWKPADGQLIQPYQRRQVTNPTAERSSVREYLERRPSKRIFQEKVTEGWPIKHSKVVWRIRLSYTYTFGKAKHTRMNDGPHRTFGTEAAAAACISEHMRGTRLKVWVNPQAPGEATVFLEYRRVWILRLGILGFGAGLLWLFLALILGRSHARRERNLRPAAEGKDAKIS